MAILLSQGSCTNIVSVGPIAQLVELRTFNPQVPGSSPGGPTFKIPHSLKNEGSFLFKDAFRRRLRHERNSTAKTLVAVNEQYLHKLQKTEV